MNPRFGRVSTIAKRSRHDRIMDAIDYPALARELATEKLEDYSEEAIIAEAHRLDADVEDCSSFGDFMAATIEAHAAEIEDKAGDAEFINYLLFEYPHLYDVYVEPAIAGEDMEETYDMLRSI